MKKHLPLLFLSTPVLFLTGCDDTPEESPVSIINIQEHPVMYSSSTSFEIVADADEVVVNDIIINRGNTKCTKNSFSTDSLPKKIKYGQVVNARYVCPLSSIREITISTDKGDWAFNL